MAEDALTALTKTPVGGTPFKNLRVRFGWSLLGFIEEPHNILVVGEPDFDGDPYRNLRRGVDVTLTVLAQQASLLRQTRANPSEVTFDQFVIVTPEALTSNRLLLTRFRPSAADDSGWYLNEEKQALEKVDDEKLSAIPVYKLLRSHPGTLQAMGLPPGYVVRIVDERVESVMDDTGSERLRNFVN